MSHSPLDAARVRAKRRRSPWNLLLIPSFVCLMGFLCFGTSWALFRLYAVLHEREAGGLADILISVGPLFVWSGPCLVLANQLVALVPLARRALDHEAVAISGADRKTANCQILAISKVSTTAGALAALLGLLLP